MKVTRANGKFLVQLGAREKGLLWEVLQRYPCLPGGYQPLSRSAGRKDADANQKLLDEALAEHRAENKAHLQSFLAGRMHMEDEEASCRMALSEPELEQLLQLLNDIRVGCWVQLGSPEQKQEPPLDSRTAPYFWAMEISGYFQMRLLEGMAGA